MLNWVHVGGMCWPLHSPELSRMLFEPVMDIRSPMRRRIILLEHPIVVRKTEIHERLQLVIKQSFLAVTIEFRGYMGKWTQPMPCEHTPHYYGITTSLHGALLTTGIHSLIGFAPYLNLAISPKQPLSDTMDWGILKVSTTSEIDSPILLAPTIVPCSNCDNSSRCHKHRVLTGVRCGLRPALPCFLHLDELSHACSPARPHPGNGRSTRKPADQRQCFDMIPTCENLVTRLGIEPSSPCWEASSLTYRLPWHQGREAYVLGDDLEAASSGNLASRLGVSSTFSHYQATSLSYHRKLLKTNSMACNAKKPSDAWHFFGVVEKKYSKSKISGKIYATGGGTLNLDHVKRVHRLNRDEVATNTGNSSAVAVPVGKELNRLLQNTEARNDNDEQFTDTQGGWKLMICWDSWQKGTYMRVTFLYVQGGSPNVDTFNISGTVADNEMRFSLNEITYGSSNMPRDSSWRDCCLIAANAYLNGARGMECDNGQKKSTAAEDGQRWGKWVVLKENLLTSGIIWCNSHRLRKCRNNPTRNLIRFTSVRVKTLRLPFNLEVVLYLSWDLKLLLFSVDLKIYRRFAVSMAMGIHFNNLNSHSLLNLDLL
ncbi:hypothetical protein PR048_011798 [Dryococelus australis]|uniref:Uncharacterized protein n=1 Tax=Dryococelus australis TaxID=614101 RepID=A0ABQ9HMI9_9NEOP|nr:hypothetical protein PR048_011798 [Dryococelus australis]